MDPTLQETTKLGSPLRFVWYVPPKVESIISVDNFRLFCPFNGGRALLVNLTSFKSPTGGTCVWV